MDKLPVRHHDGPARKGRDVDGPTHRSLEGLGSEKRKYLKWLLLQSVAPKTKIESVITDDAFATMSEKLSAPLQFEYYLTRALEEAYKVGQIPVGLREAGADVLVRFALDNLPLQDPAGRPWDLLKNLRRLGSTQVGDWTVELAFEGQRLSGRVCAIKKSRQARLVAQKKLLLKNVGNNIQTKDSTLESSGYIFVFTTLAPAVLRATQALELYRGRWQIELVFKRLKSILSLGYLRKVDPVSARSWLEGKLFVAMLIEALLAQAESFFPWGYPLGKTPSTM